MNGLVAFAPKRGAFAVVTRATIIAAGGISFAKLNIEAEHSIAGVGIRPAADCGAWSRRLTQRPS